MFVFINYFSLVLNNDHHANNWKRNNALDVFIFCFKSISPPTFFNVYKHLMLREIFFVFVFNKIEIKV